MKSDDLQYGSHSAVQKAIRRADLDLMKTSFDLLWPDLKHRAWLEWRTLILVEEEMWWMLGEVSEFLQTKGKLEKDWRRFLYQLCLLTKSKDASVLAVLALDPEFEELVHPEIDEMRFWTNMIDSGNDIGTVADSLLEDIKDNRYEKLTDYELNAIRMLKERVGAGGMYGDRLACLATMLLIAMRGTKKKDILKTIEDRMSHCKRLQKPKTVNLPWYVFDKHTAVGKMAMSVFMKHHAKKFGLEDKEQLDWLWFFVDSAFIPKEDLKVVPYSDDAELTMLDSMWWPVLIKEKAAFGGLSAKESVAKWKAEMRPQMESIVGWCLEKRNES